MKGRLPEMGEKGHKSAFGEMNKRTEQALKHLTDRWSEKTLKKVLPPVG